MIDPRSTKAYKLEKENRELKKEIKDLIELCNKYEEEHNTTFKLWKMKMEEMPNYEESISLKQRNKKAIEYINENWGHWCSNHCKYATETINILQGADKE